MRRIFILVIVFGLAVPAYAGDEYPTTGMVYNTKEVSSLFYECTKLQNGFLECQFQQISLRKKTKPAEVEAKVTEDKKQYSEAVKEFTNDDEKTCQMMSDVSDILEGKRTPEEVAAKSTYITDKVEFIEGMKSLTSNQKSGRLKDIQAFNEFCETKSEASYLNLSRIGHERDSKTCLVSPNLFTQNFRYVEDYESGNGAWVVSSEPDGPCGIVRLDRFEKEITRIGETDFVNWNYMAKKAITNTKGTAFMSVKCNELDQNEYFYNWRQDENTKDIYQLGCDYIEFSPI